MIKQKKIEVDGFITSDGEKFIKEDHAKLHEDWLREIRSIQRELGSVSLNKVLRILLNHENTFHTYLVLDHQNKTIQRMERIVDYVESEMGIVDD